MMKFKEILKIAKKEEVTKEEAYEILKGAWFSLERTLELFRIACEVRAEHNDHVALYVCGGPHRECRLDPLCKYCWVNNPGFKWGKEDIVSPEKLDRALDELYSKYNVQTPYVLIGGGSDLKSDGKEIVDYVDNLGETIRKHGLQLTITGLPYISLENLEKLKDLGVREIGCPFETLDREVFYDVKPGDSLERRIEQAKLADKAGLGFYGALMIGIHDLTERQTPLDSVLKDYVEHLFMLKNFEKLSVCIYSFMPLPGVPLADKHKTLQLEVAKVGALARLIHKDVNIDISTNDLGLSLMAGANMVTWQYISLQQEVRQWWSASASKVLPVGSIYAIIFQENVLRHIERLGLKIKTWKR